MISVSFEDAHPVDRSGNDIRFPVSERPSVLPPMELVGGKKRMTKRTSLPRLHFDLEGSARMPWER
jgi:hypothetical protein